MSNDLKLFKVGKLYLDQINNSKMVLSASSKIVLSLITNLSDSRYAQENNNGAVNLSFKTLSEYSFNLFSASAIKYHLNKLKNTNQFNQVDLKYPFLFNKKYFESLKIMENSDCLIHVDAYFYTLKNGSIFFAAKIADYIGTGKRILGMTSSESPAGKIITNYGGKCCSLNPYDVAKNMISIVKSDAKINKNFAEKFNAKNVAKEFDARLGLTGFVVTKLDSDARAGVALSLTHLLNIPIKLIGSGEKVGSLDIFYPERMADRIMGLGDIMTLAEKAKDVIDENAAKKSFTRMLSGKMDLEDLLNQTKQMQKLGSLGSIAKMIPLAQSISEDKISSTLP